MKYFMLTVVLLSLQCVHNSNSKASNAPLRGFAVVELFTSEGCSSCPPADKAVADLLSRKTDNVFILVYHVDYWDRLGWKDAFSKREFSERQRKYAAKFASNSVYTPQIIFDGTTGFVGSDVGRLNKEVRSGLENNLPENLEVTATSKENNIDITYKINNGDGLLMNVALMQANAERQIKAGENDGLTLHHVNIVRELKSTDAGSSGIVTLKIPEDMAGKSYSIIAFSQSKKTLKILSAKQVFFE